MNRGITYGGAIPRTLDGLNAQTEAYIALGNLAYDLLLNNTDPRTNAPKTLVAGFKPSFPGGMAISF